MKKVSSCVYFQGGFNRRRGCGHSMCISQALSHSRAWPQHVCFSLLGVQALTTEQGCESLLIWKLQAERKIHQETLCAAGIWQTSDPEQQICSFLHAAHSADPMSCRKQQHAMSRLPAVDNLHLTFSHVTTYDVFQAVHVTLHFPTVLRNRGNFWHTLQCKK